MLPRILSKWTNKIAVENFIFLLFYKGIGKKVFLKFLEGCEFPTGGGGGANFQGISPAERATRGEIMSRANKPEVTSSNTENIAPYLFQGMFFTCFRLLRNLIYPVLGNAVRVPKFPTITKKLVEMLLFVQITRNIQNKKNITQIS